ncbi:Peptidoglycan/LPS O-acetylase OafA/YrhL, contains acyltransferase and SGNH-hydrolase domains [Methylobacterium sp. 174MFSha1.1]|uniref:acyltransferase family protein n=1 Tax=Methylobacterium sp. 174MFSha1.1 TaxID=1502749 RepID=UPI0008EADA14|nr:acyltransferase [Methylobacterium sp. 174MFSha1.1]SFU90408.1 Peptidoglycan/LPS O-acetylase OafA/YrhL, contains acyltransferase and SGNH-hydrolase domains [Methylobacterium sp. 174MFSha1.1]
MAPIGSAGSVAERHEPARYHVLDALRGVAAFGVLVTHCLQMALPDGTLNHTPLRVLANGRSFVIFFFVLSGTVLATALWSGRQRDGYARYAARRFARLYPPYLVAGLGGMLLAAGTGIVDPAGWLHYLAFTGHPAGTSINPPSWSLVYEIRLSLVMPLICFVILRRPRAAFWAMAVLFLGTEAAFVALRIGQFPYGSADPVAAALTTARFAVCFGVGAFLAWDWHGRRTVFTAVARYPLASFVAALVLMSVLLDQLSLIAAILLIVLALEWPVMRRVLMLPVLLWLGRISYSLYLTHVVLLEGLKTGLSGLLPVPVIVALAIPTALLLAEGLYEFVEKPSIAWARRISGRPAETLAPSA